MATEYLVYAHAAPDVKRALREIETISERIVGEREIFEEPVDVAIHPPTGNILVTDIWNRRIQVLSPELEPLAEWAMPTWESQDLWDKAYVTAAADGTVYATDPQFSQVYIISAGTIQASFGKFGSEHNRFAKPTGLAIDPLSGELLIADADNNRILVFDHE